MEKRYEVIDKIIATEIYLYSIFMFLTRGEAIRNVLLFSSFFLWLITLKYRSNKWILKEPVPLLFWGLMASILISAIFSIEPLYSLQSLKTDPLKSAIFFCLLSTTLSDQKRLKVFVYISCAILVFTISVGYYSYWAYNLPLMKPVTWIRHAWHSRFAMDINTLLPFTLIILLLTKEMKLKLLILFIIMAGILGVILSTARGGLAGFTGIALIWMVYFLKTKKVGFKIITAIAASVVILFSAALFLSPLMKEKFISNKKNIMSLGKRTEIWKPLVAAALERPIFGWGYGSKIFSMDTPFEDTFYKVAPVNRKQAFRNPHNAFLKIFFHQGIVGLILYLALIITATRTFWKGMYNAAIFKSYVLTACASIMTGTFFINSLSENPRLISLTFILGIGLAAHYIKNENSHS